MKRALLTLIAALYLCSALADNREIRVALLADLHITPQNNNDKMMPALVDEINNEHFDLVITAGDLTNRGSFAELKCAHNHLRRIKHRQITTHGNHETTWSESGGRDFKRLWGHNGCTTAKVGEYTFVAFPAGPYIKMADGTVQDSERLAWVESELSRGDKRGRVVAVCHYPLNGDITNRTEVTSLMKRYNVTASLCGHYHKPRLMNFDSLPGIVGRSLMLPKDKEQSYGYTILTFVGDSIHIAEKLIGKPAKHQYSIRQRHDSTINTLKADPLPEKNHLGGFNAECIITDNAEIYTAAQRVGNILYYGNSAGEIKAYNVDSKQIIWSRKFNDPIYSTPVITNNAIVIATLSQGIVALKLDSGKTLWRNRDGNTFIGNGTLDNGYLYIGTLGSMFKIDCTTGKTIWKNSFGSGHPQAKPTVANGKLIFGAWDCHLYCIDCQNGRELWRWTNGSKNVLYSPGHSIARVAEDRVMIVAPDRYTTCIELSTGREIWRVKARKVRESTGLSSDGNIFYAKTMDGEMIAVPMNTDSYTELWCTDVGWGYDHSFCPLLCHNGVIYMANRRGKVAAVSEDGELLAVGKFANSAANDLRIDTSGNMWISFIEGTVWRLETLNNSRQQNVNKKRE